MNIKDIIIKLFFEEHLKQKDIANIIKKSPQYVSEVLKNHSDTKDEKNIRHEQSLERKKEYNKKYYETYNRPKKCSNDKAEYDALQARLDLDSQELSAPRHNLSNDQLVYQNLGAYKTNKKGNLVLDKNLNATIDMPKYLNRHKQIPSQKMKHRVCMER